MNYSANSCESSENENRDTPQQQIIEMGSTSGAGTCVPCTKIPGSALSPMGA